MPLETSEPSDIAGALSHVEIFAALDADELRTMAGYSCRQDLEPDAELFEQGAVGDSLFVVVEGRVNVLRTDEQGLSTVIAELVAGDVLGELDFLTGTPRNATAKAATKLRVLRFPRPGVTWARFLTEHAAVSARILRDFLGIIAHRTRSANALIEQNSPWVQEIRRQVYTDKLTGLFNKAYLEETLPELTKDEHQPLGLLLFKPDNFKEINDTFGHEAGDATLRLMAAALRDALKDGAWGARCVGNELAAVFPGCGRDALARHAARLREVLTGLDLTSMTGGKSFRLGVSFGAGLFPDHGTEALPLIARVHELPLLGRSRGGNAILFPEDAE